MSGCISIKEGKAWIKATWAYEGVVSSARKYVPEQYGRLIQLLDNAVGERLRYIELDALSQEEVTAFFDALIKAYKEIEAAGLGSFYDPSYYSSFLSSLKELIDMIADVYVEGSEKT
jgi:hypothetical protein